MNKYIIHGGRPLFGEVTISGAKNAAVAIIPAALLVDGATGTVLLDQDAHTKQYPASITKVMTALLVFEAIDRGELRLSDSITASANSVAGLPELEE